MLASKSEKDALGGTLFFNVAHYVLRPWPWILTGLASLIIYPELADIQRAFPNLDPKLLGHDIAFPAMLRFLPVGWMGLMLGGLIAANSSTILTHLNWGSSYLVHDFYQRFVNKGQPDKHYVLAGRWCTVLLFICSSAMVYALDSAKDNFNLMLQVGAGTGLLYLVRWFWWRVTAWCEVAAMISSFGISVVFLIMTKNGLGDRYRASITHHHCADHSLLAPGGLLRPGNDPAVLIDFYKKVRPFGPGWRRVRVMAGLPATEAVMDDEGQNVPLALVGWLTGCTMIWSALFCVGNFLYGRTNYALVLLGAF